MVTDIRESIEKVFFMEGSEVVKDALIFDRRALLGSSLPVSLRAMTSLNQLMEGSKQALEIIQMLNEMDVVDGTSNRCASC
jgi:hypothetical protein